MKRFAPIVLLWSAGLFAIGCGQQHSQGDRAGHELKHDADRAAADAERAAADADRAAHAATDAAFRQGPVDPRAQDQNLEQAAKEKAADAAALEAKRLADK